MPKSYELKLREAEERRRPRPKEEVYKAVENQPQRILIGFDHPETLQLELQLTWLEDTFTVSQTHEHLMSEVRRLDSEYKRRPLRCNYSQKYLWFDRFVLRPRIRGRELLLQDYGIEPGYRIKLNGYYQAELMWGGPNPMEPHKELRPDQLGPAEDPGLLIRLDKGPPTLKNRLFCFPWMGATANSFAAMASKLPRDVACFALELPGNADREITEGYPDGEFAIQVIAMTLAKEMRKPGNNYFFAHSQGCHFAYYAAKVLRKQFGVGLKCLFASSFPAPAAAPLADISSLHDRQNLCVPLRILVGLVKGGWGINPQLGYKSHMGFQAYQSQDLWPSARAVLRDWWMTKQFPLPNADEPLDCPIMAFHGEDDPLISLEQVMAWKHLSSMPGKFEVMKMAGEHLWLAQNAAQAEALAAGLGSLILKFQ